MKNRAFSFCPRVFFADTVHLQQHTYCYLELDTLNLTYLPTSYIILLQYSLLCKNASL
jgi:hypothetical protein